MGQFCGRGSSRARVLFRPGSGYMVSGIGYNHGNAIESFPEIDQSEAGVSCRLVLRLKR